MRKKPYSQEHKYLIFVNKEIVNKSFDKLSNARDYVLTMNVYGNDMIVEIVRKKTTYTLVDRFKPKSKKVLTIDDFNFDTK